MQPPTSTPPHLPHPRYYLQLLDLFLETTFQTECGQLLDTLCMNLTVEDFSVERWTLIVKYKVGVKRLLGAIDWSGGVVEWLMAAPLTLRP